MLTAPPIYTPRKNAYMQYGHSGDFDSNSGLWTRDRIGWGHSFYSDVLLDLSEDVLKCCFSPDRLLSQHDGNNRMTSTKVIFHLSSDRHDVHESNNVPVHLMQTGPDSISDSIIQGSMGLKFYIFKIWN